MATRDFLLPDLGEGLTEGEIVRWLVAQGDEVAIDQPLAEMETAKAVVEVPSPFAGTVVTLHGEVGEEVVVGTPLVTIELAGTEPAEEVGVPPAEAEVAEMVPEPEPDGGSGNVLVGYGTGGGGGSRRRRAGRVAAPVRPAAGAAPARPAAADARAGSRPLAKPPVRKLAKDLGVDLAVIDGSGPEGIVTRDDVEAAAGNGQVAAVPPAEDYRQLLAEEPQPDLAADRIPVRGVRRAIAEKMTASRREIPEATTWVDLDATGLWEFRRRLNARQDVKVTPLAIVMRACVAGLARFPTLNASLDVDAGEIVLHRHVNLGFAAQTDRVLVVPVIADAHRRSILGLAEELNRLARAARDGKVTPAEMTGGTFTLSNYGSFGVDGGNPVINHPEAAILGVGRIIDRPWVVASELAVRKVMQLSIAFDHRISDGGEAGGFLRFVGDCVEDPELLLASL